MLKDVFKGLFSLIAIIIYIPVSFFAVKNWLRSAKELNKVGYQIPTNYWGCWWYYIKEDMWEYSPFD